MPDGRLRFSKSRSTDRLILLGIIASSVAVTAIPVFVSGHLHHDTLGIFAFVMEQWGSLNRFGEPAWWSPKLSFGFPVYFYVLLGIVNAGKPAFVLVGLLVWVLGRFGVDIPDMVPFYIFYFAVLLPPLFIVGVWLVARQLLRSRTALLYVLIVAAFSPGVVMNLTDPGMLEYMAYCLFCVAAYLHFVARPSTRSFGVLALCAGLVSLAFSQYALMTAIPWLPLLVIASASVSRPARAAIRSVPLWQWAAAGMLLVVTASPSLIAYAQVHDETTQYSLDGFEYPFSRLKPGNPLEFLLASVPALTFEWDHYDQAEDASVSEFQARGLAKGRPGSFNYLGVLAIPLAALGLVYGRRRLRAPLLLMLALATTVLALPGFSPLFSLLLAFPSPLRSMNHYGDLLYRGGGFLLLVLAAGMGLEAALRRRDVIQRLAPLFAVSSVASLLIWLQIGRPAQGLVGFTAAVMVCLLVVLLWAGRLPRRSRSRMLAAGVLGLTAIDVSTAAFWHIRLLILGERQHYELRPGMPRDDPYPEAQVVVLMRETKRMGDLGLPLERIPPVSAFCNAHIYADLPNEDDFARALDVPKAERSLPLPASLRDDASLRAFFERAPGGSCKSWLERSGDFNTKRVAVTADQPTLVLFGDAYSGQWRATIDGAPAPVFRAFGTFKAVAVPAGKSDLRLDFDPPFVGMALVAAYLVLVGLAIIVSRLPAPGASPRTPAPPRRA
jgi:hypothetical protein